MKFLASFVLSIIFFCGHAQASEFGFGGTSGHSVDMRLVQIDAPRVSQASQKNQARRQSLLRKYRRVADARPMDDENLESVSEERKKVLSRIFELYCVVVALDDRELRSGYLCACFSEENPAVQAELRYIADLASYLKMSPDIADDLLEASQST